MEDHALIAARPGRKGTAPILLAALLGLAGCGGGGSLVGFDDASLVIAFDAPSRTDASDDLLEGSEPPDGSKADCVDRDGDRYGFGLGCLNVDCDDGDARVTDQCYCGRLPNTRAGCECRPGEQPRPCDVDSDLSYSASDTCNVGQRTCDPVPGSPERGQWSACRAWRADYPTPTRFIGAVSQCPGNCSPRCRHQVICPESGDAIPAGSTNVVVANAAHSVFCPGGAGLRGGITTTCTSTSGGSYTRGSSPLSWRDACAAPGHQTVLAGSDDGTTQVSLPFTFSFYGAPYATAGIATNGMISFVDPTYWWVNSALPTGDVANTIFAFWDDVYNRGNGECIAVYGSAPGREYVVQWSDQFFYPPGSSNATEHMTYQVVLAETTHTIDVLYNQMEGQGDRATGNSATVGIQQGTGSSFDLVGYNTAGVTPAGRTLRWTPSTGSTVCSSGVYRRVYEGTTCDGIDAPYWGQFNFSSIVPQGARIEFRVRVAQTSAGLASAPWTRLPDAPNGAPSTPSSIDVGANLRAARPSAVGADHLPFLELQATLIPSPDGTLGPTLISTEVQFTCAPPEEVSCRMGAPCYIASDPCRRGVIRCLNAAGGRPVETCVDAGALPPGTSCGTGSVCNASGVCVPCNEGAACSTGLACATGRLSCATGAPLCAIASQLPVGTVCGGGVDVYTRLRPSPAPWVDVCSLAGHRTFMTGSDDGTTGESLPFTFRFYGSPYSYVGIASNGQLSFVLPTYSWVNSTLPTSAVENTIFGFWDDIYQRNGICTATVGAAPLRRYIAEWEDNFFYPPGSSNASEHLTFEISLSEGSNAIDVLYSRMEGQGDRGTGGDATIGIQRDTGSTFDLLGYNAAGVASGGSSVRWLPGSSSVCNAAAACVACANGAPCTLPGVCVIGVLDCSTGAPVCTNAGTRAPTAESCNGVDDDCDGAIDNGVAQSCYTGPAGTRLVGRCRDGIQACATGAWGACAGQTLPAAESCNGIDDDCDGSIDEGLGTTTCGTGPCQRTVDNCVGGVVQVCVPQGSGTEVCNNLDDDCDGLVDEGLTRSCYSGGAGTSGVGLCHGGAQTCVAGSWGVTCPGEVLPSTEVCDGQDNDCDGLVDEGNCRIGGACFTSGQLNPANNCQVCVVPSTAVSGPTSWSAVAAGTVCRPSAGVCDVAESCNGSGAACPGNGFLPSSVVCRASTSIAACDPAESCTGSSAPCPPDVVTRAPTTELCDAIDNDCDGVVDDPWVRPSGCVPGVEVCDRVDNDCDGLVDDGLAGSAACPGRSCEDIYAATMSVGSGYYWLNPTSASTAGRFEAWCDMAFDGSGWTLVGRSRPGGWGPGCAGGDGGASFGWRSAQGSVRNDAAAYSLNAFGVGLPVTQMLFGSYAVGKSWGANVFRHTVPSNFVSAWGGAEFFNGAPVTVAGPCAPGMFGWIGYTAATDQFHLRDVPGGAFGLTASGWASCYDASCYAGNINGSQGQIMARAPALSYGYLAGACTVGVGACARVGALVCTADGRGTACSVTAGSPSAEVCDGLDNDCNGLVDEGYCRIGGACFSNGQLNPANNCQVCVVPSTAVSGPTSWSAVAAGTVCRAAAGVCDVAESCNGSGAACPPNGYIASGTVCRASVNQPYCDPAESCTGASALCPTNVITRSPTTEVCNGADDDCDGVVDDGNPGSGAACWSAGTGSCVNAGTLNCVGGTLACSATPRTSGPCTVSGGGGAVSYSQPFTSGVTPGSQCTAWNTFRASLTGTYDRVTIRGSRDGTGVSCTGPSANTLCQALRNNTVVTGLSCGGRTWNVGNCAVSGYASEISADGDTCSCSAGYIVRPCIGNLNWGGVNGSTCGATDQTMVVECGGAGGASTSCNSSGVCACSPTAEVCNGVDDDCDGAVDDIASTPCSPGECRTGYTYCSGASTLCAWSGNSPVGTWCSAGRCDGAGTCRPSNDRPENAIYLGSLPGGQLLTSGNTCGATTQPYAWCNGQSEIYYYVYVTQRSVLYADTFGSAFDTVLNVSSNGYDSYACNDDSCGTVQSQIAPGSPFVVNPGYYYISVGGWAGGCGAFTLRVQAVPASNPVIQVARGAGQVAYYSTAGQANMVNLGCGAAGGDITFYWTLCPGVGGGTFSANTCSGYTSYDTVAEFFDGTSGYAACNDDSCGLRSSLSVGVNAGPGIRAFYEDGWGGNVGNNYTVFSIP